MSHELVRKADSMPITSMDDLARLSEMFAKSGYFKDARDAAQVGVKVLAGREMGFGPFASVNGVHIIQGKPAMGANLMAAAVKASGKYDYRVREMSNDVCRIEFFQAGESIGVSEFTAEDAKAAGTQNLQKFARNMLFARCMSNGVRWFCPDVFLGSSVYTPEELGAAVDGEGDVLDAQFQRAIEEDDPPAHTLTTPEPAEEPTPEPEYTGAETVGDVIGSERAEKMEAHVKEYGVRSPLAFAKKVLKQPQLTSLESVTEDEAKRVVGAAKRQHEKEQAKEAA